MLPMDKFSYDAATAISQGRRDRQEDALISDFPSGSGVGFAVLADGMGGHAAGDVASKIVVTEVFSELKLQSGDVAEMESRIGEILRDAAIGANDCVGLYSQERPDDQLMGATLLAPVLIEDRLFWISVGDSPFYLMRDGVLSRLNEDHAVGSQIDFLVASGLMERDEALNHPEQDSLTSVLVGEEIPQIDCPAKPFQLAEGDILVAASDGLLVLGEEDLARILRPLRHRPAEEIAAALMTAIENADDPHQDNVSLCVIRVVRPGTTAPVGVEDSLRRKVLRQDHGDVTIVARVSNRASATG
ncbi:PP2C family protein-serine/threonine phosphatase [Marimonas arenosa]|uniref:Protein phosphatase 2C domain-containing protein n=1 Tax=Marimonas arenosa TaxID=1795305 RepID=A0AAE3WCV7_9RHOB|nr:protein phosphatase 2C domain-containing protein [Marimonas arenosa]MDQ2090886.1 protein phosphatase 2C domain-containing protein [Marimonas arenosa]